MTAPEEKGYTLIADVALFAESAVLLVKYADSANFDGQPGWFLPDTSLKYLEHPDKAVGRLLKEQLGLEQVEPKLDHIESFRGNDESWHLSFHYRAELDAKPNIKPSMLIGATQWFPLNALPAKEEVAHHGWSLNTLKKMLQEA